MKSWSVQDAKARFSEFLETCLNEGPQIVTKRGADAAVLVPLQEWRRLQRSSRPTLKELLLSAAPRADLAVPERGRLRRRQPDELV
ncbi:MAG: type II toxin-antitoxin system Phd/YefM family antitoxin [Methylocystis sp.]|nr:type II toxin-antitoxin system Phd/YefM family antitoxin [Methylocystis sp.]